MRDSVGIGAVVVSRVVFIFGSDVVVAAHIVVNVTVEFGVAVGFKTFVVMAAAVDVRVFASDGVDVVVEDGVEWNSFLIRESGAALVLWTNIRFVFLFLQQNKQK